ncbi:glutamine synthetase family protein [Zavarzinia sp. CC-PAN008]|uniref:glutamine synthetase family protein n=1 Tax=Zavarzinia sp. CC-PAN008 TaxID=3243332 RepID=UPI003F7453EE
MNPSDVKTPADVRAIVEARGLSHVKVGVFDLDGVMRGKYLHRDKLYAILDSGFGFCDVLFGWDSNDQLYENVDVTYTGWHTAFPDAPVRLVPESCRDLPLEGGMLLFLLEFVDQAEPLCPRGLLKRVLKRADHLGYAVTAAAEFEFFVFDETPDSIRAKGYRGLKNLSPGFFGYSMIRNSVHAEVYRDLLALCQAMRMPVEGIHTETGPGVIEAALQYCEALEAADRGALFKTFTKILFQRQGKMATFMAKWSHDYPGQSGHLHVSLKGKDGAPVFHDAAKPHNISDQMRWFIGGQQALMPELLAMVASTVNSYTRLIPGFWAPTDATWGIENRTCALRAIPGSPKSQRVEYRVAAADINPYLALAAAIGSGLWGIENMVEPDAPIQGNAYALQHAEKRQLPRSLGEASGRLKGSTAARDLFGDAFVDHFAATRMWEQNEASRAITDWQLARYFEII